MKIALLGYGKMGKEIEQVAVKRGHEIVLKVNSANASSYTDEELSAADVAIEFSVPAAAVNNIRRCFSAKVPVVVGTTAWLDKKQQVLEEREKAGVGLLYSSNFSIGVNLFFELNRKLAELMKPYSEYEVSMEEIHHVQKLDAPSGTAISLANDILDKLGRKNKWVNQATDKKNELSILSVRTDQVPGTHNIVYNSEIDSIKIEHVAHNRKGFALGSVVAAEFIHNKNGLYTMADVLK